MLSMPALDPPVFMAAEFPKPVFKLPELKKPLSPAPEFPKPADSKPGVQAAWIRASRVEKTEVSGTCAPDARAGIARIPEARICVARVPVSPIAVAWGPIPKFPLPEFKEADVVVTRVPEPDVADARIEIDADLTVAATPDADVPVPVFGKPILLLPLFPKLRAS
jgi:hypothetical protein